MPWSPPEHAASRTSTRVLVVDDDDTVRGVLVEALVEEGFDVVGDAIDGVDGVSLALELTPDTVLLDVRMPRMGGIEAAHEIASRLPDVRIVLLSAYDDPGLQAQATAAGACAYLVKGCSLRDVVAAVAA